MLYLHTSIHPSDRETVDLSIYRYAEKKAKQIGDVEWLLKMGAVDMIFIKM